MDNVAHSLRIVDYDDRLAAAFHDINKAWIEDMFVYEEVDRVVLENPRKYIVDAGGVILFVEAEGRGIVGAGALKKSGEGEYELTKMGVTEDARGLKAGEFLLQALIARAGELGATKLYLLTNAKCEAAVHLYEKNGFALDVEIMRDYGGSYDRCNVAMRWVGKSAL